MPYFPPSILNLAWGIHVCVKNMRDPQEPEGHQAPQKDKASSLKNIGGKGCAPRKALPRIDLMDDVRSFVEKVPIGGMTPTGPRTIEWQKIGIDYISGQIVPGHRKSMEPITKRIVDGDYQQMQQFITDAPWNEKATMNQLIIFCRDEMSSPNGVLIVDDTGEGKQGKMSPGVARQYFSEIKNVGNCQVAVTGIYAEPRGPLNADILNWSLGMRLYLPKEWDSDDVRRKKAGIPPEVRYTEKWKLALDIVSNARDLKVPHKCVLADAWYGTMREFRAQLRAWTEPYILGVSTVDFYVTAEDTPILLPGADGEHIGRPRTRPFLPEGTMAMTPERIAETATDWEKVDWGEGTKGRLSAKFIIRKVRFCLKDLPTDEMGTLLIEKGVDGLKSHICWGLNDLPLQELVKLAHCRWAIEDYHKTIKDELGFDHFEGRKYRGWQHHAVLTQMTFALLEWLRFKQGREDVSVPLPTLPEVKRLLIKTIVDKACEGTQGPGGDREIRCSYCKLKMMIIGAG